MINIPDGLCSQADAQALQLLWCDTVFQHLLNEPLGAPFLLSSSQHSQSIRTSISRLSSVLSPPLFPLPFCELVLMNQCPFLRRRVCQHLPAGLFGKVMPTAFVHKLKKFFLYDFVIGWPGQIEAIWRKGCC
jgi:hypothetical protein